MFEMQVERSPQAIAVIFENTQLTYEQLNQHANQLAHMLRALGVGPNILVGICLERSLEMIVGLLGILKAGGAYVPLDPAYPLERLAFIFSDTQTPVLLTQENLINKLPPHEAQVVCLDSNWQNNTHNNKQNPINQTTADDLIYVIYTSGSTGHPKGVMIPHAGICNQLYWKQETFGLTQADKVLLNISFSFDPSVWQIFWPLCFGGQLIIARPGGYQDTAYLVKVITEHQITIFALVPSMLRVLLQQKGIENCQSLRHIICGGEALPVELIERFFAKLNLDNVLHNCYGPTEASIDTTFWTCQRGTNYAFAPIGRPITNVQIYILNENLQSVPVGESGELYIGGIGLARGYMNRPELTTEKFIFDPFSSEVKARLYKTGDLVRYLNDGNIQFLGRIDHQVKVRGFRIELEEIETILNQHPAIHQTVVIARENFPGDQRLVAYLVPHQQIPTNDELRRFLKQKLPDYMIPSSFVILEFLPLTPNGKIDRDSLPAPNQIRQAIPATKVAAQDDLELRLTEIWEKVLGIQPIGMNDNYFDLGGYSLLAVHLFTEIEKTLGQNLPLSILYQAPTIKQLADIIRQSTILASWSSLVAIQPSGTKPPLFLIHAVFGDVLSYKDLARHLGFEQPVYGLQAQGLDGKQAPYTRIEDMASHYLKEVQTLQPNGPYLLGGHSFGGVVAFEMAQQLHKQGQKVGLLTLFHSSAPAHIKQLSFSKEILTHLQTFFQTGLAYLHDKNLDKWLLNKFIGISYKFHLFFGLPFPRIYRNRYIREVNIQALKKYVPSIYPGQMTFMQIEEQVEKMETPSSKHITQLGWANLVAGELDVHYIPGTHDSILKEPNVQILSAKLKTCLEKSLTKYDEMG
ncbi:amino acid adenylation domain-containing protein [Nostocaceae cyanobacterium CENA357]|uniref:Amino acid adenylation domain-containing protein n=2 Tax=Atlanticothrix TaxID=2840441 RepID=A0A8J7L222_9CYAN|nr:amino acid adenylation domain-containing protein [Atlanticothrix silvestris CENA357]